MYKVFENWLGGGGNGMDLDDVCSRVISCLENPCHTLQLEYATTVGTGGDRDRVHYPIYFCRYGGKYMRLDAKYLTFSK